MANANIDEKQIRPVLELLSFSGQPYSSAASSIEGLHGRQARAYVANLRARPIRQG
jgi:hypothetical protein